jgi:hypothetical protein
MSDKINGNEFRIISIEKLSLIKNLLDDLVQVGERVELRVEVEEDKPQEDQEGKS